MWRRLRRKYHLRVCRWKFHSSLTGLVDHLRGFSNTWQLPLSVLKISILQILLIMGRQLSSFFGCWGMCGIKMLGTWTFFFHNACCRCVVGVVCCFTKNEPVIYLTQGQSYDNYEGAWPRRGTATEKTKIQEGALQKCSMYSCKSYIYNIMIYINHVLYLYPSVCIMHRSQPFIGIGSGHRHTYRQFVLYIMAFVYWTY